MKLQQKKIVFHVPLQIDIHVEEYKKSASKLMNIWLHKSREVRNHACDLSCEVFIS